MDQTENGGDSPKKKKAPVRLKATSEAAAARPKIAEAAEKIALGGAASAAARKMEEDIRRATGGIGSALGRHADEFKSMSQRIGEALGPSLTASKSASERIAEALGPRLADYKSATERLADLTRDPAIEAIRNFADREEQMKSLALPERKTTPVIPKIPANPIHKTNKHLAEVSEKLDALIDVAAKQAGVADTLLTTIIEAAAASDANSKASLRISKISMWTALMAVVASIAMAAILG